MGRYLPVYLKSKNRKLIYDLFVQKGQLSRSELASATGMSFPTVSKVVNYLLSRGIILESDQLLPGERGLGRRSRVLQFNPGAFNVVGAEFEGNFADFGLVDMAGQVIEMESLHFPDFLDLGEVSRLAERIKRMVEASQSPVLGMGVGFSRNVDPDTQEVLSIDEIGQLQPVSFAKLFAPLVETLNFPVFVENDVNLAAKGEIFSCQPAGAETDLVYLTLGTGFGAGIILHGQLWQGATFKAGEIGYMMQALPNLARPVEEQAATLENCINIAAINQRFGLHIDEDPNLSAKQRGEVVEYLLPYLVQAIYNFAYMFDVETFVFSGYIPRLLGKQLYERLSYELNRLLKARNRKVIILEPSSPHSVIIGAASLVFENMIFDELAD